MTGASDWASNVGDSWADEWQHTDRSFAGLVPALDAAIAAAAPSGSFRALDIGCGAGATSLALATARPDARVTGIDISEALIAVARTRSESRDNLNFVAGDAPKVAVEHGPADLMFSRHGVMFFPDPVAAFTALHAAAAPGAKFIFSCFRGIDHNPWAGLLSEAAGGQQQPGNPAEPGPFAFADPARVEPLLTAAGWRSVAWTPVDYRYLAGAGPDPVEDALAFLCRIGPAARLLNAASAAERPAVQSRVRDILTAHSNGETVEFAASAWIYTLTA